MPAKGQRLGFDIACEVCGTLRYYKLSHVLNGKHKYCNRKCQGIGFKTLFSGENNPAYGKTYRTKKTHPEWAANIREGTKGINTGLKNGMKDPDVRKRMAKTRREQVTSDPQYCKERSDYMLKAWADGKYDNVHVGKCKWYDHKRTDGSIVKLQGTWEVALARRLDELGVDYEVHRGRWEYKDPSDVQRSYYPDFFIPMWNTFIDVKGAFWDIEQRDKISYVKHSNLDKRLVIATRDILNEWCVKVTETQNELLRNK